MGVTIGVIGLDRIGSFHADTLSRLDNVDGLVVADDSAEVSAAVAARFDAEAATDAAGVLAADVDGLVISAAAPEHVELILSAAAAGIPVFCEKPLAASSIDSDEVARRLTRSSVPVRIGFDRRLDPTFAAARAAIAAGEPGWLHAVRSASLDTPPHHVAASGGIVRDCAIHDFDVVLWVVGTEAAEVYVTASCHGPDRRLEARGSAGGAVAGWNPGPDFRDDLPSTYSMERFTAAYRAELTSFVDVIAGTIPSPHTAADVLEAAWIAEAAAHSLQQHRPSQMSEVRR